MGVLPGGSCISNTCMKLSFEGPEMSIRGFSRGGISASRFVVSAGARPCDGGTMGRQCGPTISQTGEERPMDFTMSDRQKDWLGRVQSFMTKHVRPAVPIYQQQDEQGERWKVIPVLEDLKKTAKAEGLWNMFMPPSSHEDDES